MTVHEPRGWGLRWGLTEPLWLSQISKILLIWPPRPLNFRKIHACDINILSISKSIATDLKPDNLKTVKKLCFSSYMPDNTDMAKLWPFSLFLRPTNLLKFLKQWFSTGVPQNPWVLWKALPQLKNLTSLYW